MSDDFGLLNDKEREFLDAYKEKISAEERERLAEKLQSYFNLTRYSVEVEGATENPEWDAGFQAAMALINEKPKLSNRYFGCAGCGEEQGSDGDYNYCTSCQSYKYFGWIESDE